MSRLLRRAAPSQLLVALLHARRGSAGSAICLKLGARVPLQISEGEPLLLSYGPLSNDFLLMDYGFLVPGNPHDRVTLRYDVDLLQVGEWGVRG